MPEAADPVVNPPYAPPPGPAGMPPPVPPEPEPDPDVQAYLEAFKAPPDPRDPVESEIRHQDVFPPSDVAAEAPGEPDPFK